MRVGEMAFVFPPSVTTLAIVGSADRFPVRRVYCVGRNYVEHIREMKEGDERDPPFFFQKPSDAVVSEGAVVPYPPTTEDFQFEVELVVALKRGGSNIAVEDALDCVYGYAVGIDFTRRDLQAEAKKAGKPWAAAKAFEHSAPLSAIASAETIGHPLNGNIWLKVNGELRQQGDLDQMIWKVPEIIAELSKLFTLAPGDVIEASV